MKNQKVHRILWLVLVAVLVSEIAAQALRQWPVPASPGAVYHWPAGLEPGPAADGRLLAAEEKYHPDRGGLQELLTGDGIAVTAFYFEWDRFEAAPDTVLSGHGPETCNRAQGFQFVGALPVRVFLSAEGGALRFDAFHFRAPGGDDLFVFKSVWLQGAGDWNVGTPDRMSRIRQAFVRSVGAARFLEGGVMGTPDPEKAWAALEETVLAGLNWSPAT